jgi:hypothetical protein
MATVLICGLGAFGGWALEFLARDPAVDRIVVMDVTVPDGPSRASLAEIGAVFQGSLVHCEQITGDIMNVEATAAILDDVDPDVVLSTVTLRSPRSLMAADIDPETRALLQRATFGMWLPNHLLPVTRLTQAALEAGVSAPIVNTAFPDVVNRAIWRHLGRGPVAGAGNGEVAAATLEHYLARHHGVPIDDIRVALVASHAFFTHGPQVPYWARAWVNDLDVTDSMDVDAIVTTYPEPIDWRQVSTFSIFAATAAKNVTGLLSSTPRYTHVAAPNGLPGSYPVMVSSAGIELALPAEITLEEAVAVAEAGNAHDGIERIEDDGTVVFTSTTSSAMHELGYDGARVRFDELDERVEALNRLFAEITN